MIRYRLNVLGQQEFWARFEVLDAETGGHIKGATVTGFSPGASVSKITDVGGNAAFRRSDFRETLSPERSVSFSITAPGYAAQEAPFVPDQITSIQLRRAAETASSGLSKWVVYPVLAVLGVGLIAGLARSAFVTITPKGRTK